MDVPEDKALELTISPEMLSGLLNTFMRTTGGGNEGGNERGKERGQERDENMNMTMDLGNLLTNGQLKLNVNLKLNLNNPELETVTDTVDPISYPNQNTAAYPLQTSTTGPIYYFQSGLSSTFPIIVPNSYDGNNTTR